MALIMCSECGKEFSDRAACCPHCGCPTEDAKKKNIPGTRQTAKSIKITNTRIQTTKVLRDYLENARTLETDLYTYDKILEELPKQKIIITEKPTPISAPQKPSLTSLVKPEEKSKKVSSLAIKCFGTFVASLILFAILTSSTTSITFTAKIIYAICIISFYATPVLFIRAKRLAKQEKLLLEKYEYDRRTQLQHYERNNTNYRVRQAEIKEYEEQLPKSIAFNNAIDKTISDTKASREKTYSALTRLYSQNVIHPKYRGIIPITMFCEYMDTNRRSVLTGENGMYDLYESELLGKQIVGELQAVNSNLKMIGNKLDRISSQLTGIQRNQMLLYEEVARGNSISERICLEMSGQKEALNAMKGSLKEIKNSTELTAFNSKATRNSAETMEKIATNAYAELHY